MDNARETLTTWLESGDTQRVLTGLMVVCKKWGHKDLASDITFQASRYNELKDQQAKQIISLSDFQLESAKLRQALIELISDLADHWTSEGLENIPATNNLHISSVNWKKRIALIAGAIAFLGGLAEFSGYSVRDICKSTTPHSVQTSPPTVAKPIIFNSSTSGTGSPIINAPNSNISLSINPVENTAKKDSLSHK